MLKVLSTLIGLTILLGQAPAASRHGLPDQFGEVDSVAEHTGEVAVVIIVTARRLRTAKPWQQALHEGHPELRTFLVADVPDEPEPSIDRVAAKLAQRVPEGVRVLIDIDRRWATELSLDTSRPNLLLLDSDGHLVESFAGRWSPEAGSEFLNAVDGLLGES